uniref:Uncharacterized protein n=1 Tax=Quercus lobata TaxID=97700 RepID=A0A7N2MWF0_QUELO
MQDFQATLLHCGLVDLGFQGNIFTWNNGRLGDAFVQERLDRACAMVEWKEIFPIARVTHLQSSYDWKVGDGRSIGVFTHSWLSHTPVTRIEVPPDMKNTRWPIDCDTITKQSTQQPECIDPLELDLDAKCATKSAHLYMESLLKLLAYTGQSTPPSSEDRPDLQDV